MCFVYFITEEITIILGMECCWTTALTARKSFKDASLGCISLYSSCWDTFQERGGEIECLWARVGSYRQWLNFIWLNSGRRERKKRGFLSDFSRTWKLRIPGLLFQPCIAWVIWTLHSLSFWYGDSENYVFVCLFLKKSVKNMKVLFRSWKILCLSERKWIK